MTKKLGYKLFGGRPEKDMRLFQPGLFQWAHAFEEFGLHGAIDASISRDRLEEHDIVHINFAPANATYTSAIREILGENSDTKIIVNIDYGTMMWNTMDPFVMRDQLKKADFIFHVESRGARILSKWLGREIKVIPHPLDTDSIKQMMKLERTPTITAQYHRYNNTWCEYFYALDEIGKEYGLDVILMNYSTKEGGRREVPINSMFTEIIGTIDYRKYLQYMAKSLINVDMTYDNTYGRGVVDAAALGVPTVGSNTIEAMRKIWPELAVEPWNSGGIEERVRILLDSEEARNSKAESGRIACDEYSLKSSYDKMVAALEEEGIV
jgi:hypothetical protein